MKLINQAKIVTALTLVLSSAGVLADKDNKEASSWTPFTWEDVSSVYNSSHNSSNNAATKEAPIYSDYSSEFGTHVTGQGFGNEALSIGFEDNGEGWWQVSLDLNQSHQSLFPEEQYRLKAAYSPDGADSKFYINYGSRRVPVSIKVDEFLDYNTAGASGSDLALGFDQKLNDNWAVSISYTKSDLKQSASDTGVFGFDQSLATNQQYWFDLNKDGLPEAVNLFSEIGVSDDFDQAFKGIEIRLTRQVSDKITLGGALHKSASTFDWQPYQFDDSGFSKSDIKEQGMSLFSQIDFGRDWSLDANLSRKLYQQKSPQVVSLVPTDSNSLNFDSTTLDIGLQYQGRWDDMGLVIRIDLVNLLGQDSEQHLKQGYYDETGLVPYTFQSPKYIKLSGSINF